uniref:Capsid protein n=1 Tax=Bryopsis mitochondria-associated dsRNA TaxID=1520124 RepID=O63896_9VIRU|nr:capsid protein [Bryopsis mitochondria-associated dsRNA]
MLPIAPLCLIKCPSYMFILFTPLEYNRPIACRVGYGSWFCYNNVSKFSSKGITSGGNSDTSDDTDLSAAAKLHMSNLSLGYLDLGEKLADTVIKEVADKVPKVFNKDQLLNKGFVSEDIDAELGELSKLKLYSKDSPKFKPDYARRKVPTKTDTDLEKKRKAIDMSVHIFQAIKTVYPTIDEGGRKITPDIIEKMSETSPLIRKIVDEAKIEFRSKQESPDWLREAISPDMLKNLQDAKSKLSEFRKKVSEATSSANEEYKEKLNVIRKNKEAFESKALDDPLTYISQIGFSDLPLGYHLRVANYQRDYNKAYDECFSEELNTKTGKVETNQIMDPADLTTVPEVVNYSVQEYQKFLLDNLKRGFRPKTIVKAMSGDFGCCDRVLAVVS